MEPSGGNADLGAEAELAAIGELRRRITQHDGRVDFAQKFLRRFAVFGHDRIGMMRAIAFDMRDRGVDAIDHPRGDNGIQIFGAPILLGRGFDAPVHRLHRRVAADLAAGVEQHGDQRLEQPVAASAIDQQRLGGAAYAGAAHFGVEHDRLRHRELGLGIDVDVANAFEMREHRHPRFGLHAANQIFPAARHDDIDSPIEARKHHPDRLAVASGNQRDRGGRQSGLQ